jgi:NitT/TauT family transport system substrate-binding protein
VYWYVPKDSPIKSIKDLDGKVLVYSRPGSTTHTISKALLRDTGVKAELVSVGGMAAARTQVMSGQVATGWAAAPAGLDLVRKGEVRIIARGNEAKELADWSIRSTAANSNWVANNRDAAKRFMRALWKGIRFQYEGGDRALERFAKENKYDIEDVRRGHEFTPLKDVTYTPLNLAPVMRFAVEEKMIPAILTDEQVRKLVDIVYDPAKDG